MDFDLTAVGMGLAKVAELARTLRDEYKDQNSLRIILQFESANLDAKQKAFELYVENVTLKQKISQMEASHTAEMAKLTEAKQKEIADIKEKHLAEMAKLKPGKLPEIDGGYFPSGPQMR